MAVDTDADTHEKGGSTMSPWFSKKTAVLPGVEGDWAKGRNNRDGNKIGKGGYVRILKKLGEIWEEMSEGLSQWLVDR